MSNVMKKYFIIPGAAWYDPNYAYLHTDSSGVIVE